MVSRSVCPTLLDAEAIGAALPFTLKTPKIPPNFSSFIVASDPGPPIAFIEMFLMELILLSWIKLGRML